MRKCKICRGSDIEIIHSSVRDAARLIHCNVLHCKHCDLVFLDEKTRQGDLNTFYRNGQYRKNYSPHLKRKDFSEAKSYYGVKLSLQERRFEKLRGYFTPEAEVLEIGCATGGFLKTIKDKVKEVKGIELHLPHVKFARKEMGLDVEQKSIEELQGEKFDIICCFHVLEHISDPLDFLEKISNCLRKNGTLIIEVPDAADALLSVYDVKKFKDFYFQKPHLFYFSNKSIKYLLKRAGFKKIELKSYQHYGIINHLSWVLSGESCNLTKVEGGANQFPLKHLGRQEKLWMLGPFFDKINGQYKAFLEKLGKVDTLLVIATRQESMRI